MGKRVITLLLVCVIIFMYHHSFSQSSKKSVFELIVDPDYKGYVYLFNKPNGKIIRAVKNNFKDEDFLTMKIKSENDSMFFASVFFSMRGFVGDGWVKKDSFLGVYSRNYASKLKIYYKASVNAGVKNSIDDYLVNLIQVVSYKEGWAKIKFHYNNKVYTGWIPPEMQCANPYTTCN